MARCEQGYLCQVCGQDVEELAESDLYLRFVLGEVDPERLHLEPERHIRCNPTLAQFVVDDRFEPLATDGAFDKRTLDADFVATEEERVTAAYRRLVGLAEGGTPQSITDYLPEAAAARWR